MEKTGKSPIFLLTALTVVIALVNLMLLLLAGPADISRIAPKNPGLVLAWCALIVALGVAIQVWLRNKPKYKTAKLLAYAFTVAAMITSPSDYMTESSNRQTSMSDPATVLTACYRPVEILHCRE